jgi:hypothetical protein
VDTYRLWQSDGGGSSRKDDVVHKELGRVISKKEAPSSRLIRNWSSTRAGVSTLESKVALAFCETLSMLKGQASLVAWIFRTRGCVHPSDTVSQGFRQGWASRNMERFS